MALVSTVLGEIDSSQLGKTYVHEHIFVLNADIETNYPEIWGDEDERVNDAVAKLTALCESGIKTIVDPTVIGLGRYIPRIQRVAAQVPELNIIVATGCYSFHDVPFYFHHRTAETAQLLGDGDHDPMVDMFIADIRTGISTTGVKAALLKCAIDEPGLTPGVERIMRAVAQAHLATDVPITVHTHPGSHQGRNVLRVMQEEGVATNRIVLGHSGDSHDVDHLSELADAGFWLGMDRFGLSVGTDFETRCNTVIEMCRRGYAERMMLSHDAACFIDWVDPRVLPFMAQWTYLHIGNDVLPYLKEHGVSDVQITTMLEDNPRRYFEGS
jgi:phosphotriesterase-related protein